jgi:hypothetical protein
VGSTCSTHGGDENVYTFLVAKLEDRSPHGKLACRWKDNIKIDLKSSIIGCNLVQDSDMLLAVVNNTVMNLLLS